MSFFKIKLRRSDKLWREYLIKIRPYVCVRCGKSGKQLDVSHFWVRSHESTRFDMENCDFLCHIPCHDLWGHGEERKDYEAFKIKQLGQEGFDRLMVRAHSRKKRDDKMDVLYLKAQISTLTS